MSTAIRLLHTAASSPLRIDARGRGLRSVAWWAWLLSRY